MSKLSFAALRAANASRAPRWHTSEAGMMEWTIGDWFMAMAGETGEMADELLPMMFMLLVGKQGAIGNIAKKYRRYQEGIANKSADPSRLVADRETAIKKLFEEIGDIQIYLDLFALRLREALDTSEDIGDHVETKFNKTSELYGFPERLINGRFMLVDADGNLVDQQGAAEAHEVKYGDRTLNYDSEGKPWTRESSEQFAIDHVARVVNRQIGPYAGDKQPTTSYVVDAKGELVIEHHNAPDFLKPGVATDRYTIHTINVGSDSGVKEYKLDKPFTLEPGEQYKFGIRDGKPLAFKVPDRPTVWHDGCALCEHCCCELDGDPYCIEPSVKAQHSIGLGINQAVEFFCCKEGKLSLFEPRRPKPALFAGKPR